MCNCVLSEMCGESFSSEMCEERLLFSGRVWSDTIRPEPVLSRKILVWNGVIRYWQIFLCSGLVRSDIILIFKCVCSDVIFVGDCVIRDHLLFDGEIRGHLVWSGVIFSHTGWSEIVLMWNCVLRDYFRILWRKINFLWVVLSRNKFHLEM